jgi:hypothetical protein
MRALRPFLVLFAFALAVHGWAAAQMTTGPDAFISVRGVARDTVEVGEPLFVAARFEFSAGKLVIAPANKTWVDAVQVTLTGGGVSLRAVPTSPPEQSQAAIDEENAASAEWYFDQAAMSRLKPGDYVVKASLSVGDGTGWIGEATSDEATLRIVAPSDSLDRRVQHAAALANAAFVAKKPEEAARVLDPLLTDHPDNIRLLLLRAKACAQGGDVQSALICVYRADNVVSAQEWSHPSAALYDLRQQLLAAAFDPSQVSITPPAWTKPPASVLAPLETPGQDTAVVPTSASPTQSTVSVPTTTSTSAPTSATPAPPVAAQGPGTGKVVAVAELVESKILVDVNGQWAASAKAGSEYSTPNYGAVQMVGPPDVPDGNDSPKAWCHNGSATGLDWVELTFAKPVHATEVRVRQNYNPGAIVKVEAIDSTGASHLWWEGVDPARPPGALNAIAWFAVRVPQTEYLVAKIKLTLDLDAVVSYQEIDAVQLVGAGN